MNGVFGDGLNEAELQKIAIAEMKRVPSLKGLLLIGLNGADRPCFSATAHKLLSESSATKIAEIKKANHQYYVM